MNTFFKGRLFIAYIGTISLASSICIPANAEVVTDWNNAALDAIRAVSGHSTFSGAAATVVPLFYGTEDLPFTAGSDFLPGVYHSFTTCLDAAEEAAVSRLNEAKSKITPSTLKNTQVVYSSMIGQVKIKSDGIDANGKPIHVEWSGKFDGKDYPVSGDPNSDARSYTKVNERTLTTANKKNGKVTVTGQIVVSADGKSRTLTLNGTTPKGKKFKNVAVYDKQ